MNIDFDNDLKNLIEFENDFHWASENYNKLYEYKNEYVAIKHPNIYHSHDIDELLKILKENNIEPAHTFIQFISKSNTISRI
jgi:hypothetical protein